MLWPPAAAGANVAPMDNPAAQEPTEPPDVLLLTDAERFADRVRPVLEQDPVTANVLATVLQGALEFGAPPGSQWIVVESGGQATGAAMITPPFPLYVLPTLGPGEHGAREHGAREDGARDDVARDDLVAQALVAALLAAGLRPPGVSGPVGPATAVARAWQRRTGQGHRCAMSQGVYEVTELVEPGGVRGSARTGTTRDQDLCVEWLQAFADETHPDGGRREAEAELGSAVARRLARGGLTLWEVDGRPVSLAGTSPVAAGVARVGPVYTPPPLRRHGYAAGVTAVATRAGFTAGAQRCMLYTDLANPTSNALYQRLGYRRVGDAVELTFTG
jgi:hypothetical protein